MGLNKLKNKLNFKIKIHLIIRHYILRIPIYIKH